MAHETPMIPQLVADLMSASLAETQRITNTVIDNLTEQEATSRAELAADRARIRVLLNGPYQPSSTAIEAALWPSDEDIDRFRTDRDRP